jgi:two-component system, OmpR family, sensor histidine kinase PhoQ
MASSRKPPSIHLRLLAASLLILPLFLGVTAWVLDRAFSNYQFETQRESMRLQQLLLAKAVDWDGSNWRIQGLDEPRLSLLNSGLYAFLLSPQGTILWQSPSAQMIGDLPDPVAAVSELVAALDPYNSAVGENQLGQCVLGHKHVCQSTRVAWGSAGPESVFLIVESQARVIAERNAYRTYLLWLCLVTAGMLLLAQSLIFRWGLAPLRRIAAAIKLLEGGKADRLDGPYPEELVPLTDNINILLASERRRRERVRNTMDRLTHVLKTPLMLIRNSTDADLEFRHLVQDQVSRMLGIVEGELARARLDGRDEDILGKPVLVQPVLLRIVQAYARLPRPGAKGQDEVHIDTTGISPGALFYGDHRDLQDLFGSVLENSLKYCRGQISVTACIREEGTAESWLELSVGDDGDGIPAGFEEAVLERGARADTAAMGQGLGLAIAVEIVSAYGGSLHIDRSDLGGALFVIKLPGTLLPNS